METELNVVPSNILLPITDICSYVYCKCEEEDCRHIRAYEKAWAEYWKGYKLLQQALKDVEK